MEPVMREELLRAELARVLSSACFARSDGVSKLLQFLVERHIEGKDDALKESVIGVEVFGRRPDYDPKLDSTVRTAAVRLRARLSKYYSTEGSQDPFVIEVPKGGYVPRCRPRAGGRSHAGGSRRLWLAAGLAGVAILTATTGVLWARHTLAPIQIAVLPLVNLSEDARNEYFADGLTDEIIRNLSIIDGLTVRSQTSSFALKGKPRNLQDVGSQLKVDYIVEGSVRRSGEKVRIDAQLVRVRDDVPIWVDKFERELTDVISIQDEISRGIVNGLRLKLGRGQRRYEISVDAYELYLRARTAENQVFPGSPEVIALYEQAISKDSSFAPAYAGLANVCAWQSFDGSGDRDRHHEALEKARAAAEKALELDPLLAEAHSALGVVYASNAKWELAERSFRRAIEIDPNTSTARQAYMRFVLWPLGRIDEAAREARAAERNDPLSTRAHANLAVVLLAAGRYDEAASQCGQLPSDLPMFKECTGRVWLAQGKPEKAIPVLVTNPAHDSGYLAYAYERAGRRAEAEKLAAEAPTLYPNRRGHLHYALVYAGLRDTDRTIEQLLLVADVVGPVRIGFTLNTPEFEFVRGDPRTKALRHKVGLPE
jgi:TolB-like protein/Flp pilus assembly protein TadD